MKIEFEDFTVAKIRQLWRQLDLVVNHEYQRAPRWQTYQKQHLVDSVLRGYPLPLFFLHKKRVPYMMESSRDKYEVVDGQQRIRALVEYADGDYPLLDPVKNRNRFAQFIVDARGRCDWAGKHHKELDERLQTQLDDFELKVVVIESDDDNEVRDLFVRLQGGSPLTPQEKRDALPGGLTQFIKRLGGETRDDGDQKPTVEGGHAFFRDFMKLGTPKKTVEARHLAAQIIMNLHRANTRQALPANNNRAIDEFYNNQVGFDEDGEEAKRLTKMFDDVVALLKTNTVPPPNKTEWIHIFVLWQRLQLNFSSKSWRSRFRGVLISFKRGLVDARRSARDGSPPSLWTNFGMHLSGRGNDSAKKNELRRSYFDEWFLRELNAEPLDEQRIFDPSLRDELLVAQDRLCGYFDREFCDKALLTSDDSELHHIMPHSQGGKTVPDNAVLVHYLCNREVGDRHEPITSQLILRALGREA